MGHAAIACSAWKNSVRLPISRNSRPGATAFSHSASAQSALICPGRELHRRGSSHHQCGFVARSWEPCGRTARRSGVPSLGTFPTVTRRSFLETKEFCGFEGGAYRSTARLSVARHKGFRNLSVMRSDSPMASYRVWSKMGLGGWPEGALRRVGGKVQTPNG